MLDQAIKTDIHSNRALPREREMFKHRFDDVGSISDWAAGVVGTPRPPSNNGPQKRQAGGSDGLHVGAPPPTQNWRESPIDERKRPNRHSYPDNVVKFAAANTIALISGAELLVAVQKTLSGEIQGTKALHEILRAAGVVRFSA